MKVISAILIAAGLLWIGVGSIVAYEQFDGSEIRPMKLVDCGLFILGGMIFAGLGVREMRG